MATKILKRNLHSVEPTLVANPSKAGRQRRKSRAGSNRKLKGSAFPASPTRESKETMAKRRKKSRSKSRKSSALASLRRNLGMNRNPRKSKKRNPMKGRKKNANRRRNPSMMKSAKPIALKVLKGGGGFAGAMVIGEIAGQASPSVYVPFVGNVAAAILFELAGSKVKALKKYDIGTPMAVGAGVAALYSLGRILVAEGILPASVAEYIPGYVAPVVVTVPAAEGAAEGTETSAEGEAMSAYIRQAGLYGMGSIGSKMQHKFNMASAGMSGGIFDGPTTLGEYDILESAPQGTSVASALSAYERSPMGATVRQATAGMGATVEEAFAGGMREYMSVPLADYASAGRGMSGPSTLAQIKEAARKITAQRIRSGQPIGKAFRANLTKAALAAVKGNGGGIGISEPASPLTIGAAPFPGAFVGDVGGIAGQPQAIGSDSMDDDDLGEGIFG